jgi:hypothetical protein
VGLASCLCNDGWLGLVGLPGLRDWLDGIWDDHLLVLHLVMAWCSPLVVIASARSFYMVSLYNTLDYTISSLDHGWIFRQAAQCVSIVCVDNYIGWLHDGV